jgi:hypothetical protein
MGRPDRPPAYDILAHVPAIAAATPDLHAAALDILPDRDT